MSRSSASSRCCWWEEGDHFPVSAAGTGWYVEVFEAYAHIATRAGVATDWARSLPTELQRRGLVDIWVGGDAPLFEGGSAKAEFWRLTIAQVHDLIMAEGISPERLAQWDTQLAEPGRWFLGPAIVAACGQRTR